MKVIFLGTPDFAIPALKAIDEKYEIVCVVTQPDKPTGRGGKIAISPVKKYALEHNLKLFQFEKIRRDGVDALKELNADIMITCAYGQILSQEILDLTPLGVFNIHGSLLPKYRGASPIQWAIINGETTTGITILQSRIGIDDGPIVYAKEIEIKPDETAGELFDRLSILGAECIIDAMKLIENKEVKFVEQDHSKATVCKMFRSDFGLLDFNQKASVLVNLIRGLNPSPIAFFRLDGNVYKVFKATACNPQFLETYGVDFKDYKIGEIAVCKAKIGLFVKTIDGYLSILEIQAPNCKKLDIKSFLNGRNLKERSVITNE